MSIKTKTQLKTQADADIITNGTKDITGAKHNSILTNIFDSLCSIIDAETWNGIKTFGSFPILPSSNPSTDYQAAHKKYVDDNGTLWEVDAGDTKLKTADSIDMQSEKIVDMADPTADQDAATKAYVDDRLPSKVYRAIVNLTTGDVSTLGTVPVEIVAKQGSGKYINIINASVKISPTVTLEVGTQQLFFGYNDGVVTSSPILKVNNTGVESSSERRYPFEYDDNYGTAYAAPIYADVPIKIWLSSGADPSAGSATMSVTVLYTIEDF